MYLECARGIMHTAARVSLCFVRANSVQMFETYECIHQTFSRVSTAYGNSIWSFVLVLLIFRRNVDFLNSLVQIVMQKLSRIISFGDFILFHESQYRSHKPCSVWFIILCYAKVRAFLYVGANITTEWYVDMCVGRWNSHKERTSIIIMISNWSPFLQFINW